MKSIILLSIVCYVLSSRIAFNRPDENAHNLFSKFVKQYNRPYQNDNSEMDKRFQIFQRNMDKIKYLNTVQQTATFGITKFADLSEEEFRTQYKMDNFRAMTGANSVELNLPTNTSLPTNFDWRDKNAVTPVKNQEQCGSCWAFSATEAIESAWFLAGHTLTSLAPQQIVDCDVGHGDEGCNGGFTETAYEYVIRAGGIESEESYPYNGEDNGCKFNSKKVVATITGYANITTTLNETEMQVGLFNQGPLSICVDATSWQFYVEGVVTSSEICGTSLDHCVMATGFQYYEDTVWGYYNVWNVRNSWGDDWGMDGYILVERGQNLCGIAEVPTVPIV